MVFPGSLPRASDAGLTAGFLPRSTYAFQRPREEETAAGLVWPWWRCECSLVPCAAPIHTISQILRASCRLRVPWPWTVSSVSRLDPPDLSPSISQFSFAESLRMAGLVQGALMNVEMRLVACDVMGECVSLWGPILWSSGIFTRVLYGQCGHHRGVDGKPCCLLHFPSTHDTVS